MQAKYLSVCLSVCSLKFYKKSSPRPHPRLKASAHPDRGLTHWKTPSGTYDAAACRVDEDALARRQAAQLEEQDIGYQVVHGDCRRVQVAEVGRDGVHIPRGNCQQLGPGAVFRQRHHAVPHLEHTDRMLTSAAGLCHDVHTKITEFGEEINCLE